MKNIMVLGGDERNLYLVKRLNEKGCRAFWYAGELYTGGEYVKKENPFPVPAEIGTVVLPVPLSRDGNFLNCKYSSYKIPLSSIEKHLINKTVFTPDSRIITGIDYFNVSSVTIKNARLTAVGLLKELLSSQKEDILGKKALITGFGNVGKAVAEILDRNFVSVTVMARSEKNRAQAACEGFDTVDFSKMKKILKDYDFIINTVPAAVFGKETVTFMKEGAVFFELAGRIHENIFSGSDIFVQCAGMPGKHTQKSAGEIIADYIFDTLDGNKDI